MDQTTEPNRHTPENSATPAPDYRRMTKAQLIARLRETEGHAPPAAKIAAPPCSDSATIDHERRIRAILETAVEGIITIDEQGLVESVNPAAERIFGYKASELIGRNVSNLMPSPFREEHDAYLRNYIRSGKARIIGIGREVLGLRKNGTVFPMDLSVSEVRLANARLFTGFVRDITERKQAASESAALSRSLAEKNKELETIVYIASHDLRSPLVNIQGFSRELAQACEFIHKRIVETPGDTLSKKDLNDLVSEDVPEAIGFIQAGVAKMDALLSGFLRFSRLGRVSLSIQPLDMNELIAAVTQTMDYQIKQFGITLEVAPLPACMGDPVQINQVFTNLIDNAVKYRSPDRPGTIRISGRIEQGQAIFSVRDNGIGIAPEHQGKAFEIFHRLNPNRGEGEGLGLAIAQRILDRQHGRIHVESAPGQGSNFLVSLPGLE
jgi:PAS domain S-box-containing protein